MITLYTKSGSVYEVDTDNNRIRRVGVGPSTSRHFSTDQWNQYEEFEMAPNWAYFLVQWSPTSYTVSSPLERVIGEGFDVAKLPSTS